MSEPEPVDPPLVREIAAWLAAAADDRADTARSAPRSTIVPTLDRTSAATAHAQALLAALGGHLAGEALRTGETLGEGGMGRVRLAEQVALGRMVAVKSLRPDRRDPGAAVDLLREAWVTGALEHPNIIPVHTIHADDDGLPMVVLKRIEGADWSELLDDPEAVLARFGATDLLAWNLEILVILAMGWMAPLSSGWRNQHDRYFAAGTTTRLIVIKTSSSMSTIPKLTNDGVTWMDYAAMHEAGTRRFAALSDNFVIKGASGELKYCVPAPTIIGAKAMDGHAQFNELYVLWLCRHVTAGSFRSAEGAQAAAAEWQNPAALNDTNIRFAPKSMAAARRRFERRIKWPFYLSLLPLLLLFVGAKKMGHGGRRAEEAGRRPGPQYGAGRSGPLRAAQGRGRPGGSPVSTSPSPIIEIARPVAMPAVARKSRLRNRDVTAPRAWNSRPRERDSRTMRWARSLSVAS